MAPVSDRFNRCAAGIFAVMHTGRLVDRPFIVNRFLEAGYVPRLAERNADRLIALNTNGRPLHVGGWDTFGTRDESYGLCPDYIRWSTEFSAKLAAQS